MNNSSIQALETAYAILKADGSDLQDMSNQLIGLYQEELKGFEYKKPYQIGDGRWRVYYKGKRITKSTKLDVYRELYTTCTGKVLDERKTPTVREVYEKWIASFDLLVEQQHRSPSTLKKYRSDYRRLACHPLNDMSIVTVKRSMIKAFLEDCAGKQAITRKDMSNLKTLINSIFSYARDDLDLPVIDAKGISTGSIVCAGDDEVDDETKPAEVYTAEERKLIIGEAMKNLDNPYCRAIVLMFCLCVRVGEVCNIRWTDVDFGNRTVFIHSSWAMRRVNGKNKKVSVKRTKNKQAAGNRELPLSDRAIEILKLQRRITPFSEFVFLRNDGTRQLDSDYLNRVLKKLCLACGVHYLSSHKMRFYAITALANAGVPFPSIQKAAGHKNPDMTMHYIRSQRLQAVGENEWNQVFN